MCSDELVKVPIKRREIKKEKEIPLKDTKELPEGWIEKLDREVRRIRI